ncbi:GyrI-like domain-containing protein [Cellulomonas sp. URHB0016]
MDRAVSVPALVTRPQVSYVGIRRPVTMTTFHLVADRFPDVFAWLDAHSLAPAGPPFFRYHVIDMEREMLVEAGVPVDEPIAAVDGDVTPGVLPAGTYAVTTHVGHPEELVQVTADLLDYGDVHGWVWDRQDTSDGDAWGARLELLLTDPRVEPDMSRWETQLAFHLSTPPAG